ncbi:MAG: glycosyltransferase [Bacteroidota bacterium]|nr:glycosyltransferase [Bacteroidota bacterium]
MKIAIFETEHFEGAFPVIKLFDMPGNHITVLTTPGTYRRFRDLFLDKTDRYHWILLPVRSKPGFFYSLYRHLKKEKPDLFYINTISDNHLLYALVLKLLPLKRIVLTVHDINCLFESRPSWNFRQAVIHRGKKWLTSRVNEFNVVAGTMTSYLQTKTGQKKTHNIPGAIFENRYSPQTINDFLRIVVPGSLDKRRRDYDQVFDLAATADKEKLRVQLILLGGCTDDYGRGIINRAGQFQSGYCKIIFYNVITVNQDEFDRQMDAAHFVFIPSVIQTAICGNIPEIYGITKSSGNIFDVIKHAKPFIVPAGLTISPDLKTSCFTYTATDDIAGLFKKLVASPAAYEHWQKLALENSRHYTLEKIRGRNNTLFNP